MIEHITTTHFSDAQRLFHGRGQAYPNLSHVNVDWLPPVVLITLYQEVEQDWLENQATLLFELVPESTSVQVQYRSRPKAPIETLRGEEVTNTIVSENGLKYHVELGKTQNTGLFLDMANGRKWAEAQSHNANVLNLFSYTCAFSVAAIAGGAKQVVNVDLSKASLSKGRENHRLNGQNTKQVKFEGVDIFKSYGRLKKYGPYELLICDPPSFQKGSVNIERDYCKIIRRIPQLMKPNGLMMLCLNSPDLDEDFLHQTIKDEGINCQFIEQIKPPKVFKEAHQGKGLKVLIFKYIGE